MMTDLMVGSGWAGLLGCMVLGAVANLPLRAAGERRADGRPWAVLGAVGFGLLALAVLSALSALGSYFGLMGIAFAVFMVVGGSQSFAAGARRRQREAEQIALAARVGEAFRAGSTAATGGPGAAAPPSTARPADAPEPHREPGWYGRDDGDARR